MLDHVVTIITTALHTSRTSFLTEAHVETTSETMTHNKSWGKAEVTSSLKEHF